MKVRKLLRRFSPHFLLCDPSPGFTLLEVVVAMTIVGLGVVTLLEVFSAGLRLGATSGVRTAAISYGSQALDGILLRRQMRNGTEEGSSDEKQRWKLRVEPVKDPKASLSLGGEWELKEVTMDLRVQEAGRESRVQLKTLRLMKTSNP
jgi:prepilin-type N-terminal cleavage/methylation domain-containing protein